MHSNCQNAYCRGRGHLPEAVQNSAWVYFLPLLSFYFLISPNTSASFLDLRMFLDDFKGTFQLRDSVILKSSLLKGFVVKGELGGLLRLSCSGCWPLHKGPFRLPRGGLSCVTSSSLLIPGREDMGNRSQGAWKNKEHAVHPLKTLTV